MELGFLSLDLQSLTNRPRPPQLRASIFPLDFQHGWEAVRTPPLYPARVLEYLWLSARPHSRAQPGPHPAPPPRVPGLSQLQPSLPAAHKAAGAREQSAAGVLGAGVWWGAEGI